MNLLSDAYSTQLPAKYLRCITRSCKMGAFMLLWSRHCTCHARQHSCGQCSMCANALSHFKLLGTVPISALFEQKNTVTNVGFKVVDISWHGLAPDPHHVGQASLACSVQSTRRIHHKYS